VHACPRFLRPMLSPGARSRRRPHSRKNFCAPSDGRGHLLFAQYLPDATLWRRRSDPTHAAARNALADIQERHKDITRLETSIQELHQLFLDVSVLVESQGELLDQIEYYTVAQLVNYTGKAVEELRTANQYQKKVRKKMCCVIVTVIIIIVVIVAPLLARTGHGTESSIH